MRVVRCARARARARAGDEGTAPGWGRALRGSGPALRAWSGPEERVREARAGAGAHRWSLEQIDRVGAWAAREVGSQRRRQQDGVREASSCPSTRNRVLRSAFLMDTQKRFEIQEYVSRDKKRIRVTTKEDQKIMRHFV